MEKMWARLEQYRWQLHIYAHLVEERTEQKVSKMHLSTTERATECHDNLFVYEVCHERTKAVFDDTVKKIMKKDFHRSADDLKICDACDFSTAEIDSGGF